MQQCPPLTARARYNHNSNFKKLERSGGCLSGRGLDRSGSVSSIGYNRLGTDELLNIAESKLYFLVEQEKSPSFLRKRSHDGAGRQANVIVSSLGPDELDDEGHEFSVHVEANNDPYEGDNIDGKTFPRP